MTGDGVEGVDEQQVSLVTGQGASAGGREVDGVGDYPVCTAGAGGGDSWRGGRPVSGETGRGARWIVWIRCGSGPAASPDHRAVCGWLPGQWVAELG